MKSIQNLNAVEIFYFIFFITKYLTVLLTVIWRLSFVIFDIRYIYRYLLPTLNSSSREITEEDFKEIINQKAL